MVWINAHGGVEDEIKGELGGVQIELDDKKKNAHFLVDYGEPPDRKAKYYSFPSKMKQFEMAQMAQELGVYFYTKGLFRQDLEQLLGHQIGSPPIGEVLFTHGHFDHVGGIPFLRPDMLHFMHPLTKMLLYAWQHTSYVTANQFVDSYLTMARSPKSHGKEKFVRSEEAKIPRDILTFESETPFKIGDITITPYLVDHSVPGACGFILETSEGAIAISGDLRLRGRRREDTDRFFKAARDVDYFLIEGSLLHFDHYGTEDDVIDVVSQLMKNKSLVSVSAPPRDLDRLLSLYKACEEQKRMLVISPAQAKMLQLFNGIYNYPKLSSKHIGVLLNLKGKGLAEKEEEFQDLIEEDYYNWERDYLHLSRWDKEKGHESKPTRVFIEDIKNNQDQFAIFLRESNALGLFSEIHPAKSSIHIRSTTAPYTPDMEEKERVFIEVLKHFGMYDGPQEDYLDKLYLEKSKFDLFNFPITPRIHKMHQVHINGHMNRFETKEKIAELDRNAIILPYHTLYPQMFQNLSDGRRIFTMERNKQYSLEEISKNAE